MLTTFIHVKKITFQSNSNFNTCNRIVLLSWIFKLEGMVNINIYIYIYIYIYTYFCHFACRKHCHNMQCLLRAKWQKRGIVLWILHCKATRWLQVKGGWNGCLWPWNASSSLRESTSSFRFVSTCSYLYSISSHIYLLFPNWRSFSWILTIYQRFLIGPRSVHESLPRLETWTAVY